METRLTNACIEEFLGLLSAQGASQNTVLSYRSDLINLTNFATPMTTADFDLKAALWLNEGRKTWAAKTTGRRLTSLRRFGRWFQAPMPMLEGYKVPTPAKPVPHPIPEGISGVVKMIEGESDDRRRALIALCGLAGLRCAEALVVTPNDLNLHEWTLNVRGKGDKRRVVPMTRPAWLAVAPAYGDALFKGRVTVVGYRDRFAREVITNAAARAGISRHVSSHDLRATFLTAAYNRSKDLRAVQELAGHSSSTTTETYTEVRMDTMRGAAEVTEDDA